MATTSDKKRGFVPLRSQTGAQTFRQKLYPVSADNLEMFIGDAIYLLGGRAAPCRSTTMTAAAASYIGIMNGSYDSNKRPATFSQPTNGPYKRASQGGFVSVLDDPDVTYLVEMNTSVGPSFIGQILQVNATGGTTATGISNAFGAGVTASDAAGIFRVIGLGPDQLDNLGGTGNNVEVIAINGAWLK